MNVKVLSGSALKIIAVACMLCDHVARYLLPYYSFAREPFFSVKGHQINLLFLLSSVVGRVAFPLFAFLLAEGYVHTKNVKKYVLNLLLFAVLSVIPWNILRNGEALCFGSFNVLFTLLVGLLDLIAIDRRTGCRSRCSIWPVSACGNILLTLLTVIFIRKVVICEPPLEAVLLNIHFV